MDEIQLKEAIKTEVESLKNSLKFFAKADDMQAEVAKVTKKIEDLNLKGLEDQVSELQKALEVQGLEMKKFGEQQNSKPKSVRDQLAEKSEVLAKFGENRNNTLSLKTVTAANATSDVANYREPGVREIQRGMPWVRDLFNVVTLGGNTHGSIDWWEQLAVTNNASMVAETGASSSESNLTWVRKTLSDKIVHDFIKVSKDQIKDIDFVAGEIQSLINRNMRLKENEQLLSGDGLSNNIKGIIEYAQTFASAGISIPNANLNDLIGKIKTQIEVDGLGGFIPTNYCANPTLIDLVRYAKDELGQYIFPMWAQGMPVTMQGLNPVSNPLIAANTCLVGDFTLGTVYYWDGLVIEMGYINDDFTKNLVTISARMRENLRVKDNDVKGFVYVDDVAGMIQQITGNPLIG